MAQKRSKYDPQMNAVIHHMVDGKSGQVVERQFPIYQLGRTVIKMPSEFSEYVAQAELERYVNKKAKPNTIHFLNDRVRFARNVFREYLSYREILKIHQVPLRDNILILFCTDEKKGRQSYEYYKTDHPENILSMIYLFNSALSHPKRLLDDGSADILYKTDSVHNCENVREQRPTRQISRSDSYNVKSVVPAPRAVSVMSRAPSRRQSIHITRDISPVRTRPVSNSPPYKRKASYVTTVDHYLEPVNVRSIRSQLPPQNVPDVYGTSLTGMRTDRYYGSQIVQSGTSNIRNVKSYANSQKDSEIIDNSVAYVQAEKPNTSRLFEAGAFNARSVRSYSPAKNPSEIVGNSITYLRTDKVNGPQVIEDGPVYMYASREKSQINHSSFLCDSP